MLAIDVRHFEKTKFNDQEYHLFFLTGFGFIEVDDNDVDSVANLAGRYASTLHIQKSKHIIYDGLTHHDLFCMLNILHLMDCMNPSRVMVLGSVGDPSNLYRRLLEETS